MARALHRGGHDANEVTGPLPRVGSLVGEEKEGLIFDDAPADGAAILVSLEAVVGPRKEASGVELVVAQELEHRAVNRVRASFDHHVHHASRFYSLLRAK